MSRDNIVFYEIITVTVVCPFVNINPKYRGNWRFFLANCTFMYPTFYIRNAQNYYHF